MVAVKKLRTARLERPVSTARSAGPLHLLKGSFSTRKVARQYPILAGLHRATDGALFGVIIAAAMMSALTLHWQHLWTVAFTRLEGTRNLAHRLTESTAVLEQHLLQKTSLPLTMVPTKAANLIYLDSPDKTSRSDKDDSRKLSFYNRVVFQPINHGY